MRYLQHHKWKRLNKIAGSLTLCMAMLDKWKGNSVAYI
ncbi:hypothetical protein APHWI1_0940 [Anaplasma phagocytophilum str. ApWI1]|uniref:Uncharacterized protein n=1 Tax=Anaplasma phagocytophilum str. ApWI1 TaxID=1359155 RepID=A0A0F3PYH7_ANAPH|nr:hypothetical protein APHWEB_0578 [Anaplasma phagocytophilum str. Webster]KJV85445.1 hypothetical protein APHWI1_0940 [Anaplasma phagocytophilum str. ApWI1]KKA00600.1 hypothetical protein APHDU1_0704 [Anaplasma phagocytophilum]